MPGNKLTVLTTKVKDNPKTPYPKHSDKGAAGNPKTFCAEILWLLIVIGNMLP